MMGDAAHYLIAFNDGTFSIRDIYSGQCLRKLTTLEGINLYGVDLSKAVISPDEFAGVLQQNGAVIASSAEYLSFQSTC